MRCFVFSLVFIVGCQSSAPTPAPAPATTTTTTTLTLADFREANRPRFVDGVPGESTMGSAQRRRFCEAFITRARSTLAQLGDTLRPLGPCVVEVLAAPGRAAVDDVKLVFDVAFFFRKPFAAASYDRETKTLYLPLQALESPWFELSATKHEWLHASLHAQAQGGDARSASLETIVEGPKFRPDAFHVDEVVASACDIAAMNDKKKPPPWRLEMGKRYLGYLGELIERLPKEASRRQLRFGVAGYVFEIDEDHVFIGGLEFASSVETLRRLFESTTRFYAGDESDYVALWCS